MAGAGNDYLDARDGAPFDLLRGGPGENMCVADAEDHRRGCVHALVAGDAEAAPILLYHVIGVRPAGAPFPELYVPLAGVRRPDERAGAPRRSCGHVAGALRPLARRAAAVAKPVVVSFDDGFRNQYTRALPILRRHGWVGTLNLIVAHLHEGTYGLGPREVRHMIADGWEVDSHMLTHPSLPTLDAADLQHEVAGSRHQLHALFGIPLDFFCYPYGAYDAAVIDATRRAGYRGRRRPTPARRPPRSSSRCRASVSPPPPGSASHRARNDPVTRAADTGRG